MAIKKFDLNLISGKIRKPWDPKDVETVVLGKNEGVKIPKGIEHCPVALEPSVVLMFEPSKLKSKGN